MSPSVEEMKMQLKTLREIHSLGGVMKALRSQAIDFDGPFRTVKGPIVFRLRDQIVLESELDSLLSVGELNADGISTLLRKLRAH